VTGRYHSLQISKTVTLYRQIECILNRRYCLWFTVSLFIHVRGFSIRRHCGF